MNVIIKLMIITLLFGICYLKNVNAERWQDSLQRFKITDLSILKIVKVSDKFYYGLIIDPDKYIHTVVIGSSMGRNNGDVISITAEGIEIEEVHSNGKGGWITKKMFIKYIKTYESEE